VIAPPGAFDPEMEENTATGPQPFAVFDVEALSWDRFRLAVLRTWPEGDCETFHSPEALAGAVGKLNRRVVAHYGGRYDFFFLPPLQSVILSGSGILRAQLGQARLYDSWMMFQMSLAKIGKAVGVQKFENKSDRIEELSDAETAEHCAQDCLVLQTALEQHQKWTGGFPHPSPRWPATAGATAVYVQEALEPDVVGYLARQTPDIGEWFDQSCSVTGGRVEIHAIGVRAPVHTYDINSSYPRSWLEGPVPLGPFRAVEREDATRQGVYLAEVEQHPDSLPLVAPDYRWSYAGQCWLTSEELRAVREARGTARVLRGWVSERSGWVAREFVEQLYAQKQAGSPWAKVAINSLHGKFSQGVLQGTYYRQRDGSYLRDRELVFPSWHQRPVIAAFVLARARLRLWRTMQALLDAGWEVYYCDTDCVHTNCPPQHFPGALGDGCGEWKHECGPAEAVYVAPKVYGLSYWEGAKHIQKVVSKGLPKKEVTFSTLLRAASGERVSVSQRAGLVAFLSQTKGWGPTAAELQRTLCIQTGGKERERGGLLIYSDWHRARQRYYPTT
jgi:hypothetical protein